MEAIRRRSRHLLTTPLNQRHFKSPSKTFIDLGMIIGNIAVIEEDSKQADQSQFNSFNQSMQSSHSKSKKQHDPSKFNRKFSYSINSNDNIYSHLPTIANTMNNGYNSPSNRYINTNSAIAQKKMQSIIKIIASKSSSNFLDFSDLKFKLDRIGKVSINDPEFLQEEKVKLENVYHKDLVNLIKEIDNKTTEKETIRKEMHNAQNKITLAKLKIDETLANFRIYQQAAQKQCSVIMYQRFTIEKERVSKLIINLKHKQELFRKMISNKKEMEFELSIQLKELKSKKAKNIAVLAEYYNDLLEKATDLRNGEGLSWIVYKLLELGYHTDRYRFPLYLTKGQITFLLNYSKKKIEYTQLRLIYDAIKKKYSVHPKKNLIDNMTIKIDPALLENKSPNYIKFLTNYYNDKNSSAYTEMDGSGLQPITFLRLLEDLEMKEKEKKSKYEKDIKLAVDKDTLEDIAEIKSCLEKTKREICTLIENETKVYQVENENDKVMNFAHYQKIYYMLFGKYVNTISNQIIIK